jgi:hypothetical protein
VIVELLVTITTLGSGVLALRAAGLRGWGLLPLGLLLGTSLVTTVATVQAALALPTSPAVTLTAALVGPAAWWSWVRRAEPEVDLPVVASLLTLAALVPLVWLFRIANLARVTPDSFNLIMSGTLMHRGRLDEVPPDFLEDWQVALGAVHAAANAQGEFYLRSATPLLALAAVATLIWFVSRSLAPVGLDRGTIALTAGLAGALLLSSQRFLYNAFYLNRHVLVAALLLVAAAAAWGLARGSIASDRVLLTLLAIALPGLALGRAETPIVAGMVLVPLLASSQIARQRRAGLLALLGTTMCVWYGPLVIRYAASDRPMSLTSLAMLVLGLGAALLAVPIHRGWPPLDPLPRWTVVAIEVVLWIGVVGAATIDLEVLRESLVSTVQNVVLDEGGWGVSLLMLAAMVVLVAVPTRGSDRAQLRFPLTAFIPFALLLTYVRAEGGLPYRVGRGDSFNRMLLHLVPLAIFYVATASTAVAWRRGRGASGPARRPVAARPSTDLPPRTETP